MPLDPHLASFLARRAGTPPPRDVAALRTGLEMQARTLPKRAVAAGTTSHDLSIPNKQYAIPARLYQPAGGIRLPLTLFFHGGGFIAGSLETHDALCREMGALAETTVLSVEYRLAPDHPFPAGVEDCAAALRWAAANAAVLGVDPGPFGLAGDSAGASLALIAAMEARDSGITNVGALLLLYPCADVDGGDYPSRETYAHGYGLTEAGRRMLCDTYAPTHSIRSDRRASVLRESDFGRLPPTRLVTAECDVLRDEGQVLAAALERDGTPIISETAPGMIHGFAVYTTVSPAAAAHVDRSLAWLHGALRTGSHS